jgi:Calpain family cysteine protease/RTX calcium-binding nonapeptide repeat (4 copies)
MLYGEAGNDLIYGQAGNDTINGGGSSDKLNGGLGNDNILGGDGNDVLYGERGNDYMNGGAGDDSMYGGFDDDYLLGSTGNDLLRGEAGNDKLFGDSGDDRLHGDSGDDSLNGGSGRDELFGGIGADKLIGGTGIDRIVSVDGAIDIFFGSNGVANTERDEYWVDGPDSLANLPVINVAKNIDPKSVHVISQFRSYSVNGVSVNVPLTPNVSLPDPVPTKEDAGLVTLSKAGTDASLFPKTGIAYNNIDQGATGTCYFLARLSSLAKTHPQYIRDMVTELGDGSYAVQFFDQEGNRVFVRVDNDFYRMTANNTIRYANFGSENGMWVAVVEKAWAIHRYGVASYDKIEGGNSATTNTSKALGLSHVDYWATNYSATQFITVIKAAVNSGKAVLISGPSNMSDTLPMTAADKHNGEHVMMVHSLVTDSQGKVTKIRFYKLYGGPLTEMTDFTRLQYFVSKAVGIVPL